MSSEASPRDRQRAVAEIRSAEAARLLGLLDASSLPALAEGWMRAGVDSPNVRALTGAPTSGANPTAQVLAQLLAAVAAEQGIVFATLQDARRVHAQTLVSITNPAELGPQVFGLSNTVTDEVAARLRKFFGRFRASE